MENEDTSDFCNTDVNITYFINIGDNYKIENNIIIIDDDFLNKKKKKLYKKYKNNYNFIAIVFAEYYVLYFGDRYLIVTNLEEDLNPGDIRMTPNEFVIKRMLE